MNSPVDSNGQPIMEGDVIFYPTFINFKGGPRTPQVRQGQVTQIKQWFNWIYIKDDQTGKIIPCWPHSCILKERKGAQ